jgi:hypothetical protein
VDVSSIADKLPSRTNARIIGLIEEMHTSASISSL